MKRNIELIRQILQRAEALDYKDGEPPELYEAKTHSEAYQIVLMKDAGLVDAHIASINCVPSSAVIYRLTWAGHDFLDAARDDTIWKKAVKTIIKPGASWTFSMLVEWLKSEAKKHVFGNSAAIGEDT